MVSQYPHISRENTLFCLTLIRKQLEALNAYDDTPIAEWTEETIQQFDHKRNFLTKQNSLAMDGTVETILFYIRECRDVEILTEIFCIANSILLGGNVEIQNCFYNLVKENPSLEFMFHINELI